MTGLLQRLARDTQAASLIEFAMVLPVIMTLGMYGTELAYMSSVNMQVSQLAMQVTDNASRMEQTNVSSVTPTVSESDITSVLAGAVQQGTSFNFTANGRIVLSSLEMNSSSKQYIHWQRCTGSLTTSASAYGVTGAVLTTGMGSGTTKITASSGSAVMFAEVYYQYKGIFGTLFVKPTLFKHEAAFLIRDDRNVSAGVSGTAANAC